MTEELPIDPHSAIKELLSSLDVRDWYREQCENKNIFGFLELDSETDFDTNVLDGDSCYLKDICTFIGKDGVVESAESALIAIVQIRSMNNNTFNLGKWTHLIAIRNPKIDEDSFLTTVTVSPVRTQAAKHSAYVLLCQGDMIQIGDSQRYVVQSKGKHNAKKKQKNYFLERQNPISGMQIQVKGSVGYSDSLGRSLKKKFCKILGKDSNPIQGTVLVNTLDFNIEPGGFCAILGPSGSGKSTVLKCILGNRDLFICDRENNTIEPDLQPKITSTNLGYVPQDGLLHKDLTATVSMQYSASLRLPELSRAKRKERWQKALSQVWLARDIYSEKRQGGFFSCREKDIGRSGHAELGRPKRIDKLSGGQRRRLQLASELLTSPALLILDEPTTGLDAAVSESFMRLLRWRSWLGQTILFTTHDLTGFIDSDQVLLLGKIRDGEKIQIQQVFHGTVFSLRGMLQKSFDITSFDGLMNILSDSESSEILLEKSSECAHDK